MPLTNRNFLKELYIFGLATPKLKIHAIDVHTDQGNLYQE